MSKLPTTEVVLADASNSTGGLGKIGTVAATSGVLYVRLDNTGWGRTDAIDWRVKTDQASTVQAYRARTNVTGATITLADATAIDDGNTFVVNGVTYTAEDTAIDAAWASRKFYTGGTGAAEDAVQIAALMNADNTITPNGSVSVGDTITVATTCDERDCGGHSYVYTAAAVPSYTTRVFDQSGNQAAELASIVLALNHRRNFKLASVLAGTTVTVVGQNGVKYTYTAHASTTTEANREFSIGGTNAQDAAALATCINDATYGVPGYTATVQSTDEVHISRNSASVPEPILSASASTVTCTNVAGGVPGVVAVATGATGELALTPTWVKTLAVTTSNGTRLATADIDLPGVYAVASSSTGTGIVTLSCTTPGSPVGGEKATTLHFAQGTSDANEAAWVETTLASLVIDGALTTISASNATSAGQIISQTVNGWDYAYLKFANTAGSAANITIGATRY